MRELSPFWALMWGPIISVYTPGSKYSFFIEYKYEQFCKGLQMLVFWGIFSPICGWTGVYRYIEGR